MNRPRPPSFATRRTVGGGALVVEPVATSADIGSRKAEHLRSMHELAPLDQTTCTCAGDCATLGQTMSVHARACTTLQQTMSACTCESLHTLS